MTEHTEGTDPVKTASVKAVEVERLVTPQEVLLALDKVDALIRAAMLHVPERDVRTDGQKAFWAVVKWVADRQAV